ncbi:DUF7446 family protein [Viridibacillus arvi]|uniref:DUF7446 family protein n=1 Tax=Viridibacillus arvi TaxID=263475 RepID=UPI0034CE4DAB
MEDVRLVISTVTKNVYAGELDENGLFKFNRADVTDDFKRCIVHYCSESVDFEIDGMKFRATCERIG